MVLPICFAFLMVSTCYLFNKDTTAVVISEMVSFWCIFQVARGGHSATLVGSRLIIFGGEDSSRRLLNDLYALDLEKMTWDVLETT